MSFVSERNPGSPSFQSHVASVKQLLNNLWAMGMQSTPDGIPVRQSRKWIAYKGRTNTSPTHLLQLRFRSEVLGHSVVEPVHVLYVDGSEELHAKEDGAAGDRDKFKWASEPA